MVQVKHKFTSAKGDGPDTTRLRPSNWNDDHDLLLSTNNVVIGRTTAGPGAAEEIPLSSLLPAGLVLPYAGTAAPSGWALCFGQAINRAANPLLFAAIGTSFGAGDGATTFNVPDMRGMVPGGKSNMGGVDRGNLTGGTVLGAALSSQTKTASTTSNGTNAINFGALPLSSGVAAGPSAISGSDSPGGAFMQSTAALTVTGNTVVNGSFGITVSGVSSAFSVVQPTLVVNYIINLG